MLNSYTKTNAKYVLANKECIIHAEDCTGVFKLCNGSNNNSVSILKKYRQNEKRS